MGEGNLGGFLDAPQLLVPGCSLPWGTNKSIGDVIEYGSLEQNRLL